MKSSEKGRKALWEEAITSESVALHRAMVHEHRKQDGADSYLRGKDVSTED
jgi:hypothetical protein